MKFINSYKQLEKLCNEIYQSNHGISAYIDDMSMHTSASHYVDDWDNDLKQLKHYRWIRNQIVHEPDCTEENMCECGDAEWLDAFHLRIMSGSDPLTLYRKAQKTQAAKKQVQPQTSKITDSEHRQSAPMSTGCLTYLVGIFLFVAIVALSITAL